MTTIDEDNATVGSRIAAYLLDGVVGAVALVLCAVLASTSTVLAVLGLVLALAYLVGTVWWLGTAGLTPGKRVLGLRLVDAATGSPIGIGRALLRQLVLGLIGPVNLVQLITIPKSPRGQGWHDRVADSAVVRAGTVASAAPPAAVRVPAFQPSGPPLPTVPATGGMVPPPPGVIPPPPASVPSQAAPVAPTLVVPPPVPVVPVVEAPSITAAAPPPPAPRPVVEPIHEEPVSTTVAAPVSGQVLAPPSDAGRPRRWVLSTNDGSSRLIDGTLMIGRDPDSGLVEGSTAWAVQDPALTVSKTHALVGLDGDQPWIEDWHSTNGVLLRRTGSERELAPHQRTPLEAGDQVELGDFVLMLKGVE